MMFLRHENKYNGKFRSESMFWCKKNSPKHDIFMKNQAKPLIFQGFPCQNFPTVNHSSRHAYCRASAASWAATSTRSARRSWSPC